MTLKEMTEKSMIDNVYLEPKKLKKTKKRKVIEDIEKIVLGEKPRDWANCTMQELREILLPKDVKPKKSQMYFIQNSEANRTPNLTISKVLNDKLQYMFRIGCGLGSFNALPVSWITNENSTFIVCLMKDRGHITVIICEYYSVQFSMSVMKNNLNKVLTNYKSIRNYKQDTSFGPAVKILENVKSYLELESKRQKDNGIKKADQTVSIEIICNNVPDFNKTLNNYPVGIEVAKESMAQHIKEVKAINNGQNPWIDYQLANSDFTVDVMAADGSSDYLKTKLRSDDLSHYASELPAFNGESKCVFSSSTDSYRRRINEFYEPTAFKLLALREHTEFANRGSYYNNSNDKEISTILWALHDKGIDFETAKKELDILNKIAMNPQWEKFEEIRLKLISEQDDTIDTTNLKDASVGKEDMGSACVDMCRELISKVPGMKNRTQDDIINRATVIAIKHLSKTMEKVVDDESIFMAPKSMDSRFDLIVLDAFDNALKELKSGKELSKSELKDMHLQSISDYIPNQKQFKVIKFTNKSLDDKLEFSDVNLETGENIELGRKMKDDGYTIENTFAQQKHHNHSEVMYSDDGNYDFEDTKAYWSWYATENLKLVNENYDYLVKNKLLKVITDAEELDKCFNGG